MSIKKKNKEFKIQEVENQEEVENNLLEVSEEEDTVIELPEEEEDEDEDEDEDEEEVSFPVFGDIDPENFEDDEEDEEDEEESDTKSLIGMLINKKYSQLKKDVEEIVANKIASKI